MVVANGVRMSKKDWLSKVSLHVDGFLKHSDDVVDWTATDEKGGELRAYFVIKCEEN